MSHFVGLTRIILSDEHRFAVNFDHVTHFHAEGKGARLYLVGDRDGFLVLETAVDVERIANSSGRTVIMAPRSKGENPGSA